MASEIEFSDALSLAQTIGIRFSKKKNWAPRKINSWCGMCHTSKFCRYQRRGNCGWFGDRALESMSFCMQTKWKNPEQQSVLEY